MAPSGVPRPKVALVTSRAFADADADAPALASALARAGVDAETVPWDEPDWPWGGYALVVVRSTWDYVARRDEFLAWASSVERLANPAAVLGWNTDKRYLADLAAAGVAVVPTTYLGPGDQLAPQVGEFVVKPSVGAGAEDSARYGAGDLGPAQVHVASLTASGRRAMVQPYLDAVDSVGESTLVFFGGRLSHAVRRGPMLGRGSRRRPVDQEVGPRPATVDEVAAAEKVLWAAGRVVAGADVLLYARVDLLTGPAGAPLLLELEVTEPFLYLGYDGGAPARFAAAIAERARAAEAPGV